MPELRFPEFEGEWEEKSLDNILSFKNGINAPKEDYGEGIKFINVLDILNNDYITYDKIIDSVKVTEKQFKNYSVGYGDVVFQRSSETREEVGTSNVYLDKGKKCVFGGFVIRGEKIGEYEPFFLKELLKSSSVRKEITSRSGGSTRYNIGQESLKKVNILLPSLKEQEKIASFISEVDEKIEKLEKKEELWQNYKKGMMQQLFSQKLRFKDENGNDYPDWEEKRLSSVSDVRDGTHDSPKYVKKGFPLITSKNLLVNGKIDFENVNLISKYDYNDVNKRSKVDIGDILFGMIGTIGNPVIVNSEGFAIKNVALIKEISDLKNNFLLYILKSDIIARQFYSLNAGGTQKFIALGLIRDLKIPIPSISEQIEIANFRSLIDKKIENINKELEINKQFKKGLLQQMFPSDRKSEDIKTKDLSKLEDKQERQPALL